MSRRERQAGFTMVELMIAALLSMALLTTALVLLTHNAEMTAEMQGRLQMNAEARNTFLILGDGGRNLSAVGQDGTNEVHGLRRQQKARNGRFDIEDYRLVYTDNNLTLKGDTLADATVVCDGVGDPLPDCSGVGDTKILKGYLAEDVDLERDDRSVWDRTVETEFMLIHPSLARRSHLPNSRAVERYQTIFNMKLEKPKNYP